MGNRGYALTSACPDLHSAYDSCEKTHLEAFRRGEASIDNPCRDAWEDYKQCVMEVWDAKTQDYLARRAAAKGETPPTLLSTPAASTSSATTPPPTASASPLSPHTAASSTAASSAFGDTPSSSDLR